MRVALLLAASATLGLAPSAASATVMTASALPTAGPAAPAAKSLLHRAAARDIASRNPNTASVQEQRNILLTKPITTAGAHIPAGTRVSSYLVAISGTKTGEVAFDSPVLAVIADETTLAETSPNFGSGQGQAKFNVAALSDFASASPAHVSTAAFTTSGNTVRYQLDNPSADPVIVRVITAAVPEPGTWAMLIAGFGLIGAMMRRQKRQILSA